ncbi:MAG: acyl-CoA dehydrogenase family protein [Bacteroidota bacterium]
MHTATIIDTKAPAFQAMLEDMRQFMKTEVYPLEPNFHTKHWDEMLPLLEEKRTMVKERGWWCPQVPKEWGGMGLSLEAFGQVSEILGSSPFGHFIFNCQAPDAGNMEILIEFGTPAQQEQYLKPLLEGKIRSCFSMTEPHFAGSNPVQMGTVATKKDGYYHISGRKWFTTGADGAAFAIVMCLTDPDHDNKYTRASQIIVPTDTPGFEFVRNISIMGEEGSGWASHAELEYKDCTVPVENLLGGEGAGFSIAQTRLGPGRIHHCMRWIGICERAFDMLCQRAVDRELSPGKPLALKQTIQNWIAEQRADIDAARLLILRAARKIDEEGTYAARAEISIIKFFTARVLTQTLDRAIQVYGAMGTTDDTILSWWYRHERGARIYDGADEVHKSSLAKQILKKYGL